MIDINLFDNQIKNNMMSINNSNNTLNPYINNSYAATHTNSLHNKETANTSNNTNNLSGNTNNKDISNNNKSNDNPNKINIKLNINSEVINNNIRISSDKKRTKTEKNSGIVINFI